MNVLIVVPRYVTNFGDFYQFPLGMAYVAASVKKAGHQTFGLNLNHEIGIPEDIVARKVKELSIDVCMSGAISSFVSDVQRVFNGARRGNPQILNVGGNGVVSSDAVIAPDLMDIDVGIIGEGEETVGELLEAYQRGDDFGQVPGIVYRNSKGVIVETSHRKPIMDLTSIPWPDYDLLGFWDNIHLQRPLDDHFFQTRVDSNPRSIDMISSRSCPFSCTFCFHPVGKVYRERPLDDLFNEIQHYKEKYQINMVGVLDELFSLRKKRLLEFCERIKPLNLNWMVQLHVRSADPDILATMYDAGCVYISYGIESMNEKVLESMQKKALKPVIIETLHHTMERRIGIQGNLIFGDTAETVETANDTMTWWAHNQQYHVYLSRLAVFPGSPDYIMAQRDGLITDRLAYSDKLDQIWLNISNMNQTNLDHISFQSYVHHASLQNLAKLKKFEKSDEQVEGRDTAYDILWECHECGHENDYRRCVFRPDHGRSVRLFCRVCRARLDVENRVYGKPALSVELETGKVRPPNPALLGGGSNLGVLFEKFKRKLRSPTLRNPKALAKRLIAMGRGLQDRLRTRVTGKENPDPIIRFRHAGIAVQNDPFDPNLHIEFAKKLADIGEYGAARLHFNQAIKLSGKRQYKLLLEELKNRPDYPEKQDVYFISISDDPAPFRASRDGAGATGYVRGNEPEFPGYQSATEEKTRRKEQDVREG